jgi:hypothetical protein
MRLLWSGVGETYPTDRRYDRSRQIGIPRVYADFQNLDDLHRLRLTCAGTVRDVERQDIELRAVVSPLEAPRWLTRSTFPPVDAAGNLYRELERSPDHEQILTRRPRRVAAEQRV